jgi:cytochrome oxidase assembly protein ShyY1
MYRFLVSPRWIAFHLLVAVAVVVMVNLAFWQLRRLDERREFNATIEARFDAPAVGIDALLAEAGDDLDSVEWRPVELHGAFVGGGDVRIVNRSQHGRAGDNVASPFRLDDGRIVVVNRGFVPLGVEDVEPEPEGEVTLIGRVHPSDVRRRGQLSDPADGVLTEAQRIDLARLAPQMPDGELLPFYVDLVEPAADGFPEPIAEPELGERNHLSYAGQWFIFAACVVVGWVLAVRKSVARHRAEAGTTAHPDPDLPGVDSHAIE